MFSYEDALQDFWRLVNFGSIKQKDMNTRILHCIRLFMFAGLFIASCGFAPPAPPKGTQDTTVSKQSANSCAPDSANITTAKEKDKNSTGFWGLDSHNGSGHPAAGDTGSRGDECAVSNGSNNTSNATGATKSTDTDWNGSFRIAIIISATFVALLVVGVVLGVFLNRGRGRRSFEAGSNNSTVVTVVNHQEIYLEPVNSNSTLNTTCQDGGNCHPIAPPSIVGKT